VFDPAGQPPATASCASTPPFTACAIAGAQPAHLTLEWPELCGNADDRVIDFRVRADPLTPGGFSCQTYRLELSGAALY
jgi:hypothetical protein